MDGPYFFINPSWWAKYPEQAVEAAKSYGFNAVAVLSRMDDEPEIVWRRGDGA